MQPGFIPVVFRRTDLEGVGEAGSTTPRPAGQGADSDNFLERVDSILKTVDSLFAKYGMMQKGAGTMQPESNGAASEVGQVSGPDPEKIYNDVLRLLKMIPSPEATTLADLLKLVGGNKDVAIAEIAKLLKG